MTAPLYHIPSLKKQYRGKTVLEMDAVTILPEAIVGLIGPNGSGKSTLLKLLAFTEAATEGEIRFKGAPAVPFSDAVRFKVTLLTQEPYLMKRSVFENIAYGLKLRKQTERVTYRVSEALDWVGLSGEAFARRSWYELSGGEAQRVALAARLVLRPEVLLLDEPTASVDAASAQRIKDAALMARQHWGTTLVIASHDWPWLYEICDEVRHMFQGRFFGTGDENIVFGPWRPATGRFWEKELADGQQLVVPRPPDPASVAVITASCLTLSTRPDGEATPDHRVLHGVVSRMIHERHSGDIVVTVLAGNLPFTTKMSRHSLRQCDLYPGQEVWIRYLPDRIGWSG